MHQKCGEANTFQTTIDAFGNFSADEEPEGTVMETMWAKNSVAQSIHVQVRVIRNIEEQQYDKPALIKHSASIVGM